MKNLCESIEQSLATRNWYAALAVALTLPDVCCALASPQGKSNGKLYSAWFDKYLKTQYGFDQWMGDAWLTGDDCYALRCSVLHQATDDISEQSARKVFDQIRFHSEGMHKLRFANIVIDGVCQPISLLLNVGTFCRDMCAANAQWLTDVAGDATIQSRLPGLLQVMTGPLSLG